ncbi:glycosyltransferase involved in cell wall biosynthesis [Pelomonas saccharophila]|jgi:glycosyltransferase involved in cell wall biosynthesis|uniref:Glycosyltransferase involved in cell wall biosynthesis n=1 Tax=Roseateles saccharophilus TaxID=304 RepID=A0ABU1YV67_ROSSA|nr:glycosyltransferase family 2 protein [Roseateles saccharophilus]MDR7271856.1 glycosyltransferase involved in cell wall biosynthesis [Roseateles saccharophilus]
MPLPVVSIVTPAYNQGNFLRATMESVLAQDYPALEYLVIDDGSSDDSLTVAQAVAAEHPGRVTVLTQPNAGQAATLNKGWAMARGEILAYLSSDDLLCPGAVRTMVETLQARPELGVAYCDCWLIDPNGRRVRPHQAEDFDVQAMQVGLVCHPGPATFFRREVFETTGGWDVRRRQVPDFEFWLRASRRYGFARVPQRLAEYRIHEGSASFQIMSPERANEIVAVVEGFWRDHDGAPDARRSLARAFSIAARNHAQAGRPLDALRGLFRALGLRPALVLEPGLWRQMLVGFTRRLYYRSRATLRRT